MSMANNNLYILSNNPFKLKFFVFLDEENVKEILPIAHHYRTTELLEKIDKYHSEKPENVNDIDAILKNLIISDKFDLTISFNKCLNRLIRHNYKDVVKNQLFKHIRRKTKSKLYRKRWQNSFYGSRK